MNEQTKKNLAGRLGDPWRRRPDWLLRATVMMLIVLSAALVVMIGVIR
jgi:hypothetical protein